MEVTVSNTLKNIIPNFKIGVAIYNDINISESPQMLKGRLRMFQELLFFDYLDQDIKTVPGISEWRHVFKQIGTDPNRYRPSNEALLRRVQKQQYINYIHSAVDLNNFFSLQYKIPLGIYDLSLINGPVELTLGNELDHYLAVNGRKVSFKNKLISQDKKGAFGSPYVDSQRTAVTTKTSDALQLIYLKPSMEVEEANKLVSSLTKMFQQIHGGDATYKVIK
ncbi:B3/4 domain-containing protein [Metabacillus fastidiosus]|uniref:B3/B4 domain-containing protein n=1 Tax=Metabacillus fastidiosus TaxID=1458 RepID=UPI002E1F826A|nr:phenylalanine--tRNA ligase beta subunit-related protein [Metabacillus fastidiosus]MED4454093.1 phenylalanine--tRNA ligase beta subunit-related protein [Metabacillus fastidiosus]